MLGIISTSGGGTVVDQVPDVNSGADRATALLRWNRHIEDMKRADDALFNSPVSGSGATRMESAPGGFFERYGVYLVAGLAGLLLLKAAAD